VLLEAPRNMPIETARPLVQSAVANYERALELQAATFASLGDHAKGELLFGLADGWARLGDAQKARRYFERLVAGAPTPGQIGKAPGWRANRGVPQSKSVSCVGCHK